MWELTLLPFSPPSGLHWRDRVQPFFLSLELRSMPPVPGPLPRLSEAPVRPPQGRLASDSQLPGAFQEQRGQLPSAGTRDFYTRRVGCFPVGLAGGMLLAHSYHTTQAVPPLYGVEMKKRDFFSCIFSFQGLL